MSLRRARWLDNKSLMKLKSKIFSGIMAIVMGVIPFASSFQSMGWNNKYSKGLTGFTKFFAVAVPLGFVLIAIYIHLNN